MCTSSGRRRRRASRGTSATRRRACSMRGARYYLPALGRWTAVDPLADQFPGVSPYNYAANNPVSLFDPDGRAPACCLGQSDPEGRSVGQVARGAPGPAGYREMNQAAGRAVVATAGAIGVGLTPAGVGVDIYDMGKAVSERDVVGGVLAGIGFIPGGGDVVKKIGQGLRKLFKSGDEAASGLGDLTKREVGQIQSVVDEAGRPLEVVGSAASGTRRGVGAQLPVGKGPGTRSDIDYLIGPSSAGNYEGLTPLLPSMDPSTGIIPGTHNPSIGPAVRFEPNNAPAQIPGTDDLP